MHCGEQACAEYAADQSTRHGGRRPILVRPLAEYWHSVPADRPPHQHYRNVQPDVAP